MTRCLMCQRSILAADARWMMPSRDRPRGATPPDVDFRAVEVTKGTPGAAPVCPACATVRTERPPDVEIAAARQSLQDTERQERFGECRRRGLHQWAHTSDPARQYCTVCFTTLIDPPTVWWTTATLRYGVPGPGDRIVLEHADARFSVYQFGSGGQRMLVAAGLASAPGALTLARRGLAEGHRLWTGHAAAPDRVTLLQEDAELRFSDEKAMK